jgi:hypothetical protein
MAKCLLCNWVGCQQCKEGILQTHCAFHGSIGAFMLVQNSQGFLCTATGVELVGALYENKWESVLDKTDKWEEFELNSKRLKQI